MAFRLNRSVVVLLTALLFALGGVGQGFAAAQMDASMLTMPASEALASDGVCDARSGGGDMSAFSAACQPMCTSPAFLMGTAVNLGVSAEAHPPIAPAGALLRGGWPPDPYPPKSVFPI
jgi:hypothetical protein